MDLVIMAAGMGSRFGGLKQIEPIDEYNNFIIDYSIFDAVRAGFDRVVFIIKEENYDLFKKTVGERFENKMKVEYVFQKGLDVCKERTKPWGTAQAILCCKDIVKNNFLTINADDFYGADAFLRAASYLKWLDKMSTDFALVGYKIGNTISENGVVKRGVSRAEGGYVTDIIESFVEKTGNTITAKPLCGGDPFILDENQLCAVNMFCFTPKIFDYLQEGLELFLERNKEDLTKCEYLLPVLVKNLIKANEATVKVLDTSSIWYGVTYKEDKPEVVKAIKKMVDEKKYPVGLKN